MGREEVSTKVTTFDYNKMELNGIMEELRRCNWDEEMRCNVN